MWNTIEGQEIERRTLSLLPAPDIRVYYRTDPVEEYQWESFSYGPYELDGDEWKINTTLWWTDQWSDDPDECDDAGARTHYIGMVKAGSGDNGFNGLGNTIGDQLVFNMRTNSPGADYNAPWGGRSLAHELGHNYYLDHTGCGTADEEPSYPYNNCRFADPTGDQRNDWYGFDVINRISIAPPTGDAKLGDLMSYSDTRWTSNWTWNDIFTQLFVQDAQAADHLTSQSNNSLGQGLLSKEGESTTSLPAQRGDGGISEQGVTSVLIASGYAITATGEIGLERVQVANPAWLPTAKLTQILASAQTTEAAASGWSLRVLGAGDVLLASHTVQVGRLSGDTRDYAFFGAAVPWPAAAQSVQLAVDGQVKATQRASAHAPTVHITSPHGGEIFTGEFTLAWDAADTDGDPLTYLIQYSADNGASWQVLRAEYHDKTMIVDATALAGTAAGQGRLRVIASDGLLSGSDQVDAGFSVTKHAPQVAILTPDGTVFDPSQPVTLRGQAYDLEDGYLQGTALRWTLEPLGEMGSGETLDLFAMPRGDYTVTLIAADSDGQTATDTISIQIGLPTTYLPIILK